MDCSDRWKHALYSVHNTDTSTNMCFCDRWPVFLNTLHFYVTGKLIIFLRNGNRPEKTETNVEQVSVNRLKPEINLNNM
jgi:uncharacterized integral membrane protein